MLTFIPWVLLVLQKKESSDLDSGGTLPGLCHIWVFLSDYSSKIKIFEAVILIVNMCVNVFPV